ncbi:MAG: hypothetical protein ABIJ37_05390 [Pseudomonadota bacterium]
MPKNTETEVESFVFNEVQLLLAEKRTSLAAMRTGIAFLALPLSVLSVLIVTSKYYDVIKVVYLFVPALVISAILFFLGSYLIIRGVVKIHHYDRIILELKQKYSRIAEFIE